MSKHSDMTARLAKMKRQEAARRTRAYQQPARDPRATIFVPMLRISDVRDDAWHTRIDTTQPDTRDKLGRMMGDPLPGRSARDLRRQT
jgi:hypothetical protein